MLVLLIVLDSLRRDVLGAYGDAGAHTPHFDRLAAEGTSYTQAWAAASWSKPSGAAILTGRYPRALRMFDLLDTLPAGVPTLAERLAAAGLETLAISANPFISDDFDLLRGFARRVEGFRPETFPDEPYRFHPNHFRRIESRLATPAETLVLPRAERLHEALLDTLPPGDAFVLLWGMDTHAPFFVRGAHSRFGNPLDRVIPAADPEWLVDGLTARDIIALYRDMVAYADEQLGALRAALEARGRWEEALVIVTADHGEGFGEHDVLGHANGLWEELIAVPLVLRRPGQKAAARARAPVSLVDLAPTIYRELGIDPPAPLDGRPLPTSDGGEGPSRPLLAETHGAWTLRRGPHKLLASGDGATPMLFNLDSDPHERRPLPDAGLAAELATDAARLMASLDADASTDPGHTVADSEVLARLRALGYL